MALAAMNHEKNASKEEKKHDGDWRSAKDPKTIPNTIVASPNK